MSPRLRAPFPRLALALAVLCGLLLTLIPVTHAAAAPGAKGKPVTSAPDEPENARSLRAVSFNIAHGRGVDGVVNLERIAQEIEVVGADVVGLQEVDRRFGSRSMYVDQVEWLAARLGMDHAYGANVLSSTGQYGTAVLSRYPVLTSTNLPLPGITGEQRGLLDAQLDVNGELVRVLNTHLSHLSHQERALQLDAIGEQLGEAPVRTLLLGDLNTEARGKRLEPVLTTLRDSWQVTGGRARAGATFPSVKPSSRIDYVLASPDLVIESAEVIQTLASDHLPVVVDMRY